MYEHDPNNLNRPVRDTADPPPASFVVAGLLAAVLIVFLAFAIWPADERKGIAVTENAPSMQQPATPPAKTPAMPTPPQ